VLRQWLSKKRTGDELRRFEWKKTNRHHVHFQLCVKWIEQREKLWVFEHFEEDHDELFVILLLSKMKNFYFIPFKKKGSELTCS
jgi:hypothetical protein